MAGRRHSSRAMHCPFKDRGAKDILFFSFFLRLDPFSRRSGALSSLQFWMEANSPSLCSNLSVILLCGERCFPFPFPFPFPLL